MEKQIQLRKVSKVYNKSIVLEGVSLDIKKGDSIAFIGHNGSGKTTLIKIIAGLITCDGGKKKYAENLKFNYVPEHFPQMRITPREYITRVGCIEGIEKADLEKISAELFSDFFLDSMIDTSFTSLSKGSLQKVAVVQALLTKPDVLLLDEPLAGQDTDSQKAFIRRVKKMNADGVTIIMSCHEKWLVRALSKHVYAIKDQKIKLFARYPKSEKEKKEGGDESEGIHRIDSVSSSDIQENK